MTTIPDATIEVTLDDMSVDLVCFQHAMFVLDDRRAAGRLLWGYVAATLEHNPGLASKGDILPLGTVIHLPRYEVATPRSGTRRLWESP